MNQEEMQDIVIYAIRASQIGEGLEKDYFKCVVDKLMRKAQRNGMTKIEQEHLKAILVNEDVPADSSELYEMVDSFLSYIPAKDIFACEDYLVSKYIH